MDEAHEILLSSLKSSGVSLPVGVSSIKGFSSAALVSICTQSLRLILDSGPSFPTSLPDATAQRFKICAELATAIKSLGYGEEIGFYQFLYPSDEESYKLVRFLVERLSKVSSECKQASTTRPGKFYLDNSKTFTSCCIGQSIRNSSESENSGSNDKKNSCQEETSQVLSDGYKNFIYEPERNWSLQQEHVSKLEDEIEDLKRQEKMMMDEVHTETLYVQKPHDEHDVLKVQLDFAANRQQSIELHVQELDANVSSRQQGVMELETKRNGAENAVNENRMKLEQSFYSEEPEVQEKLIQLKEIGQEIEATLAEILKREAVHLDLLMEFEEQPKLPSRKSYIERITEITKNSRKLDADIKQILKETRELQLESNSIQERLHRTHAVVNEAVFREAKKDAMGRQAYGLLTSIHDSFQQIADTILATDRAQREAAALEAKLAKLSSRGFDITRLQADLDSIRKENELLAQKCHNVLPIS